jgi:hypothetical protein
MMKNTASAVMFMRAPSKRYESPTVIVQTIMERLVRTRYEQPSAVHGVSLWQ